MFLSRNTRYSSGKVPEVLTEQIQGHGGMVLFVDVFRESSTSGPQQTKATETRHDMKE
jgi:hypothetical protein